MSFFSFSCSGDSEGTEGGESNSIEGKWEVSKAEGFQSNAKGNKITFEGGKFTWTAIASVEGEYKVDGDEIVLSSSNPNFDGIYYKFSFEGSQLKLFALIESQETTLYLDKQ